MRRVIARFVAVCTDSSLSMPFSRSEASEDTLPQPACRLLLAEPVEHDGQVELCPRGPILVVVTGSPLQRQGGRQHLFGLTKLPGVAQGATELQHCVERRLIRLSVQFLSGVQEQPGLLHLTRLTVIHRAPTISTAREVSHQASVTGTENAKASMVRPHVVSDFPNLDYG